MKFAFYCSSHGFGHATRVTALTTYLLKANHSVIIITAAPKFLFTSVLKPSTDENPSFNSDYATYRHKLADPTIFQPSAYTLDGRKTVDSLKSFLANKAELVNEEARFLKEQGIHCVLSDVVFIAS
jgi:hypothetical protein